MKKSVWQRGLLKTVVQILKGWYWLIEECTLKNMGITIIGQSGTFLYNFQYASLSGQNYLFLTC